LIAGATTLHDPWFWALGVPAVILMGLAKGGFVGVGTLAIPLMAQAVPPVQAAAVLLPLLVVQDAVGVWSYRRTWNRRVMLVMMPGALAGVALGYWYARSLSEAWVLVAVGLISAVFGLQRLWIERGGRKVASRRLPDWVGVICGFGSGVGSQIAHAGGPPFLLYVVPQRLQRDDFVGTTILLFASLNWVKLGTYSALGQFTSANLLASAALVPVAIASTFAGVRLVRRVDPERFYLLVNLLMAVLGLKLIWDGVAMLF
jgi:uncharacterized membrane protein YfcA